MKQKWNSLSPTAKIAIGASVGGVALICVAVFAFCCVKQRRIGRRERELADQAFEKDAAELLVYRQAMAHEKAPGARVNVQPVRQSMPMAGVVPQQGKRSSWMYGGQRGYQRF